MLGVTPQRSYDEHPTDEDALKVPRPALTIIGKKRTFFSRIVKIKISERLLGVGSSAFDMFQMTFQFVRIRGISII